MGDRLADRLLITDGWSLTFPPCCECVQGFFVLPMEAGREGEGERGQVSHCVGWGDSH